MAQLAGVRKQAPHLAAHPVGPRPELRRSTQRQTRKPARSTVAPRTTAGH